MFKWLQRKAYKAGMATALQIIEARIRIHEKNEGKLRDEGMSGDEVQACITCLVAVAREIAAAMSK